MSGPGPGLAWPGLEPGLLLQTSQWSSVCTQCTDHKWVAGEACVYECVPHTQHVMAGVLTKLTQVTRSTHQITPQRRRGNSVRKCGGAEGLRGPAEPYNCTCNCSRTQLCATTIASALLLLDTTSVCGVESASRSELSALWDAGTHLGSFVLVRSHSQLLLHSC
jgi:hypothetical protein